MTKGAPHIIGKLISNPHIVEAVEAEVRLTSGAGRLQDLLQGVPASGPYVWEAYAPARLAWGAACAAWPACVRR